jgi:hypothetical protein
MNDILENFLSVGEFLAEPKMLRNQLTTPCGGAKVRKRCVSQTGRTTLLPEPVEGSSVRQATIYHGNGGFDLAQA